MELGVAGTIGIESIHINDYQSIGSSIDEWLQENPDVEIIDIKISSEIVIFYRKQ